MEVKKKPKVVVPSALQALDHPSQNRRAGNLSVMNKQSYRLIIASPPKVTYRDDILSPKSVKSTLTRNNLNT